MKKHYNITILGHVQGVLFRSSAKKKAYELGLHGLVRNNPDGSVYIEVEGDQENINRFIEWCHSGPGHSQVGKVGIEKSFVKNYGIFRVEQ